MFTKHSKHKRPLRPDSGIIREEMPCIINKLAKPKTLAELRALCVATGINPAPANLRQPIPVTDGYDPMDAPPCCVTGDTFEHIRAAKSIESMYGKSKDELKQTIEAAKNKEASRQNQQDPGQQNQ